MGILNLHKFLERCSSRNSLSSLRGQVVGIDAMCWLHRGSVASAWELLTGRDTDKFLRFFVKMLVLCNMSGVKPIVVFDGASLPAKAKEEAERRQRRADNSKKAKEEIEARKITSYGEVDNKLRSMIVQSVSISPEMITRTMSVLRRLNVDFVVAPYEADAQLAYMYKRGVVSGVVSEDSDLMAFGCHRLLSKMDMDGNFVDIRLDWAFKGPESPLKPPDIGELGKLEKWTESMFVDLCILSGSDYKLGKIYGIGIKKAFMLLNKFRSINRIVDEISRNKKWSLDDKEKFNRDFQWAKTAFQRHRVFDIESLACVSITDNVVYPNEEEIIGADIDSGIVRQILTGEVEAKSGIQRVFLDRLPPGVLGVYNASLRRGSDTTVKEHTALAEATNYDILEQKLVQEFERMIEFKRENAEIAKENYLSKLEDMILNSSAVVKQPFVKDDEFANIEELLECDNEILIDLDSQDETLQLLIDLDEPPPIEPEKPETTTKVKNPFAKASGQENKKPRANPGVASAMPHLVSEKPKLSLGGISTIHDALDQRRLSTGSSGSRKESFVSSRTIKMRSPTGRKFFAKR